jgi:UDP-N-acetylmuramate dehydrogenase
MIKIAGRLQEDEILSGHTSFRIGGPADLFIVPQTLEEAALIATLCARESVPCHVLGGGTNILVSDKGVRGVVIDLTLLSGLQAEGTLVTAFGGTPVSALAEFALSKGLAGMEFAYALPGSVGGAVWMNARCYEREVSDVLEFVDYLDADIGQRRLPMRRDEWEYKVSPFQGMRGVILQAGFRLAPGDPRRLEDLMQEHRQDREKKGHFLFPCAGSVFKNNRAFGAPTGVIVDSLGLKGRRIGGAQVAPFHGNIIVNTGGATARDVLALIELVEDEVRRRRGFQLEREVLLVGEW